MNQITKGGMVIAVAFLASTAGMPALAQQPSTTIGQRADVIVPQQVAAESDNEAIDTGETAAPAEPTESARALFERAKSAIVQVRLLLRSAGEQSTIGSGFVVRDDAQEGTWIVTNYHVVSSLALHPDRYRIELRGTNQRVAHAQLMAIDVRHDLAVLKIDRKNAEREQPWPVLPLRKSPLQQGSSIYSLGNPLELGFLISEGLYNGLVENRLYDQILFSGALNPGMSGGPAIDSAAQVIGVNVATRRDGELLSFLVPLNYLHPLLERAFQSQPPDKWVDEIGRQLLEHQDFITQRLLGNAPSGTGDDGSSPDARSGGFATQKLVKRNVVTLDSKVTRCWAAGNTNDKSRVYSDSLSCRMNDELFVSESGYTGHLSIQHTLLRNKNMATAQFLHMSNGGGGNYHLPGGSGRSGSRCSQSYVQAPEHVYRATICMKAYQKFDKLYDVSFTTQQLDDVEERLSSTLQLTGFTYENAKRLGELFMARLQ